MDILDIEFGYETWVVIRPRSLGNLVVGAEIVVEIDRRNIAVLVRHIHYPLNTTRHTMEAAAENHVIRIRRTDSTCNHTEVPPGKISGIRLFLRFCGGGQVHTVACRPHNGAVVGRVTRGKRGNDQLQLADIERQFVVGEIAKQVALVAVLREIAFGLRIAESLKLGIEHQQITGGFVLYRFWGVVVVVAHLAILDIEVIPPRIGHLTIVPEVVAILGL